MHFKKYWLFYALLFLGLIIRLSLATLPGLTFDVNDWFAWMIGLQQTDLSHFYTSTSFNDYPPGYMYILKLLGLISALFSLSPTQIYYLLKLPAIICELILGSLIFRQVKQSASLKYAYLCFIFILFNPAFIFDSSVWGQIDGVLTLGLFLSIYYLSRKKLVTSSIWAAIAFLIKPQTIFLAPVFGLFWLKNFHPRVLLSLLLPFLIVVFVLSWPFYGVSGIPQIIHQISKSGGEYPYTSLFAFNLWGSVGFWLKDSLDLWGVSYQTIGVILYLTYWTIVSRAYFKKKLSLYSLAGLALMSFYFLLTRVHDRYLYPALVFLAVLIPFIKEGIFSYFLGLTVALFFANLYYVYIYYNYFYSRLPSAIYNQFLYQSLDQNARWLSIFSFIIFLTISYIIICYEKTKTVKG